MKEPATASTSKTSDPAARVRLESIFADRRRQGQPAKRAETSGDPLPRQQFEMTDGVDLLRPLIESRGSPGSKPNP